MLIVSGVFGRRVTSLQLASLPAITLNERSSGDGTITFGRPYPMGRVPGWSPSGVMPPESELIPDARAVYKTVLDAYGGKARTA